MKKCECGGQWHRHDGSYSPILGEATRYRCNKCRRSITVRQGKIVTNTAGGRPRVKDWRDEG